MKKIIVPLIFILVFVSLGLVSHFSDYTVMNEEAAPGNTPANLLNGGLFCENDGKIYFSNPLDRGTLYVMDSDMNNVKKLCNDTCSYINVTNEYVIYYRDNYNREKEAGEIFSFDTMGIFRVKKKNGSNLKKLLGEPVVSISLLGNDIYYQRPINKKGLQLHTIRIDGSSETVISEENIVPGAYSDDKLIYHGIQDEHMIHTMSLSDYNQKNILYDGNCYNVVTTGKYIYFLSLSNNYAIARINLDGTQPVLLVKERCSFFNLSPDEKYLYYQVDGGDNNRLCRMNLSTLESETIQTGDYNSIHVTDHYVFFREFSSKQFYYITTATGAISSFSPAPD